MTLRLPAVRRGSGLCSALCVVAFVSACGGSASPEAISASSASILRQDVQRIRSAASGGNATQAHTAVAALRADVARLAAQGALAPPDARVLMIEAGQVDARVTAEVKPLSTPASSQPSAVSPASPSIGSGNPGVGHGHGHGGGGGNGQGGGDGGD